jgi:hypothetical protein
MIVAGVISVPGPSAAVSGAPFRADPHGKDTARLPSWRGKLCNKRGGGPVMLAVPQMAAPKPVGEANLIMNL